VHILHKFDDDFYGEELRVVVCGFIRPELDFPSLGMRILAATGAILMHAFTSIVCAVV
jgi:FAD synthase